MTDDDDLVKWLRAKASWFDDYFAEAADRIEALTADNAQLREALAFYADLSSDGPWHLPSEDYGKIARATLNTGKEPSHE